MIVVEFGAGMIRLLGLREPEGNLTSALSE